jgi:hypothetical protein
LPGIVEAATNQSIRAGQHDPFCEGVGVGRGIWFSKTTLKHQRTVFAVLGPASLKLKPGPGMDQTVTRQEKST